MLVTVTSWYQDAKVNGTASVNLSGEEEGDKSPQSTNNNETPA